MRRCCRQEVDRAHGSKGAAEDAGVSVTTRRPAEGKQNGTASVNHPQMNVNGPLGETHARPVGAVGPIGADVSQFNKWSTVTQDFIEQKQMNRK